MKIRGAHAQREMARLFAESLRDIVEPIRHLPTREIAKRLNADRFRTPRGGKWHSLTVWRLMQRLNLPVRRKPAKTDT